MGIRPEEELMLLAAGTAERRARHAARMGELAARVDWDAMVDVLSRQRLLPLGAARLAEHGSIEPPAAFEEAAAETLAATGRTALGQDLATLRLAAALEDAGIPVLPLKGTALAAVLYGERGLRPSDDVDLLVQRADLDPARGVLEGLGFTLVEGYGPRGELPLLHLGLEHPVLAPVELHWRVHWYEERFSAELIAGATPWKDGLRRADPAHELAALLVFWARDGFAGLRLGADVARWWDLHGADLPPLALARLVDTHPALRRALVTAARVAERVVGVPLAGQLGVAPESWNEHPPAAARLADWRLAGDDDQIKANLTLADLLLAPAGGRRGFVRRQLVLDDDVLVKRGLAPRGASSRDLRRERWLHLARVSGRYAIAAWRLRGGRSWAPLPGWAG